jgi:hypothetical protein
MYFCSRIKREMMIDNEDELDKLARYYPYLFWIHIVTTPSFLLISVREVCTEICKKLLLPPPGLWMLFLMFPLAFVHFLFFTASEDIKERSNYRRCVLISVLCTLSSIPGLLFGSWALYVLTKPSSMHQFLHKKKIRA